MPKLKKIIGADFLGIEKLVLDECPLYDIEGLDYSKF